jgi:hypothetical protein
MTNHKLHLSQSELAVPIQEIRRAVLSRYYEPQPWNRDRQGEIYWYDGGISVDGRYYDSLIRWHTYKGDIHFSHQL